MAKQVRNCERHRLASLTTVNPIPPPVSGGGKGPFVHTRLLPTSIARLLPTANGVGLMAYVAIRRSTGQIGSEC